MHKDCLMYCLTNNNFLSNTIKNLKFQGWADIFVILVGVFAFSFYPAVIGQVYA